MHGMSLFGTITCSVDVDPKLHVYFGYICPYYLLLKELQRMMCRRPTCRTVV